MHFESGIQYHKERHAWAPTTASWGHDRAKVEAMKSAMARFVATKQPRIMQYSKTRDETQIVRLARSHRSLGTVHLVAGILILHNENICDFKLNQGIALQQFSNALWIVSSVT